MKYEAPSCWKDLVKKGYAEQYPSPKQLSDNANLTDTNITINYNMSVVVNNNDITNNDSTTLSLLQTANNHTEASSPQ